LPFRNTKDQDIEKAPNGGAHAREKDVQKYAHKTLINIFRLIFARMCPIPSVVSLSAIAII